jgi:heat shock protein HslJ
MKIWHIFAVLTLLAVSVSACSGLSSQPDLDGTSWVLTQLQGSPVISTAVPTLVFKDGQVSGNASCNSFGGTYERRWGDALKFGPLMSTLMACVDPSAMEREGVYLGVLGQVAKYRMESDHLYLYGQSGQLLAEFKKK